MVRQFVIYLDQLAKDLPPKLDEVCKVNLQIHLQKELEDEIFTYPDKPKTQVQLILLASMLEDKITKK